MRSPFWFRALAPIVTSAVTCFGQASPDGALAGSQELVVRVVVNERSVPQQRFDASHLWLRSEGAAQVPFVRMPSTGELALAGMTPGRSTLSVVWPSGDPWWRELQLVEGAPWVVELELEPGAERVVELRSADGEFLAAGAHVELLVRDGHGASSRRRTAVGSDGRARFPECAANEGWIEVFADGALLGVAHARFEQRVARVRLVERALVVQLVDERGQALDGGSIELATTDANAPWSMGCATDVHGRAEFHGLAFDELLLVARHPAGGTRANLRVPLAHEGTTELEVVVAGGAELSIQLVDDGVPLPGVEVALHAAVRSLFVSARHTDADGRAHWGRIEPGAYHLHVERRGSWPTWHALEVDGSGAPIELDVPSRGDLTLRAIDAQRERIAGVQVVARWLARDESVADWVAAHLIAARPRDLHTDARGELELRGLPRGRYELELTTPDGARRRERIEVEGGTARTRTLTIR